MSDLYELREKAESGKNWRGSITISDDGETRELTVRQLVDPELWEVMSYIDMDELEGLSDDEDLDEDKVDELRELTDKDELTDEESDRLAELEEELDTEFNIFDAISMETYKGITLTAKYCVEPDDNDVRQAMNHHAADIEDEYGAATTETATEYVNDHIISPMIEDFTDLTSFLIGMKSLEATLDEEGN